MALAMTVCLAGLPRTGVPASWETLVMPGPVIEGHAEYEQQCSDCHTLFEPSAQQGLCLDCHEEVRKDVDREEGLHGKGIPAGERDCRNCHSDHLGRAADIRGLNPDSFDHRKTDFELQGAHKSLACDTCHASDKPARETYSTCFGCHEKHDSHRGELGEECDACHNSSSWRDIRFDHDETRFSLTGAHAIAPCDSCHADQRWENTPMECLDCHAASDAHQGSWGKDCGSCHSPEKWQETRFNHEKETGFSLLGGHAKLACTACHLPGEDQVSETCVDCHAQDDQHAGRFGSECKDCHSEKSWDKPRFDHDRDTDFELTGLHRDVSCETCHQQETGSHPDRKTCIDCHQPDDVHRTTQGDRCERCHEPSGWDRKVRFDHALTRFPLSGLHRLLPCEECHISSEFADTQSACVDCHNDTHQGRLGTDCETCHNPNSWHIWKFDHDQTDFRLQGAHEDLDCHACHLRPLTGSGKPGNRCGSCHAADDIHDGGFGMQCDRCHGQDNFEFSSNPVPGP